MVKFLSIVFTSKTTGRNLLHPYKIQHLSCTPVLFLSFLMPVIPQKPPPQLLSPEIPADPPGQIPSAGVPPPLALPSIRAAPQAPSSDPGNPLLRSRDSPGFPAFSA